MPRSGTAADAAPPREAARGWLRHRLGLAALAALLDAFDGAAIPVIPLKGPHLAEALWEDPGLRPFTDLDLLVRRADVPRAVELLGTLGYRALEWERPLAYELAHATAAVFVPAAADPSAFPVDLHWDLVGFPAGARPHGLDVEEVWARAERAEAGGRPVLRLAREDLLLYLALHLAVHHPLAGAAWEPDVALLLRRHGGDLDWERVVERARRWSVSGAVYLALRLVEERFSPGVPAAVFPRLRPRGPRGLLLDRIGPRGWRPEHLVALLVLDRTGDLAQALLTAACPPPDWVRSRYGTRSALQGYRAHYGRVGTILSRFLS